MKLVLASKLEDEVDALFRLPLAEFTSARNALAARLKKSGRTDEAVRVKALVKPSISAWAVNQLYWNQRKSFDQLIASGERFHKAQTSGKVADMRAAVDARRECISQLSDSATSVMLDAGHNPTADTIHRITTTLEAMSAYASHSAARYPWRPGRLTADVDPPGFELFGAPGLTRVTSAQKSASATTNTRRKVAPDDAVRRFEETRKTKMAAARVSLQAAKSSLSEARARAKSLEATQKKADAEAKRAEKQKRDAEESLEKAEAALKDATRRARSVADEVKEALQEVKDASREVDEASRDLEKLFGE